MLFNKLKEFSIFVLLSCLCAPAQAILIEYDLTQLDSDTFRYDYHLTNNDISEGVEAFSIYFDYGLTSNLSVLSSPTGWDSLIFAEDDFFLEGPIFDTAVVDPLGTPEAVIGLNESLSGFSIVFDWLGVDLPASQFFEIYLPFPFEIVADGLTSPVDDNGGGTEVPEPGTILLLFLGLIGLMIGRRNAGRFGC